MAKHDIVVLNSTSSGFETDLGNNIARIKGDADNLFQVNNASGVNKFAVSSIDNSMIIDGDLTLTGNLSSSINSTASFGKIDAVIVGDASQMTNVNEVGHVSSSKQLAARISGAFTAGFEVTGNISGSSTSTGSFTRVFANTYVGDASQMTNVPIETGTLSGSAQIASNISGSFNKGFVFSGEISGSSTSTGSFGRLDILGNIVGTDFSDITGVAEALPSGIISSSIPIASQISGAFTSGFSVTQDSVHGTGNVISHSAAQTGSVTASLVSKGFFISGSVTSTGSFGHFNMGDYGGFGTTSQLSSSFARVGGAKHGGKITILDTSELTGWSSAGFISSSAQISARISGSFNKGFRFGDSIGNTVHHYNSTGYNNETAPTASINVISGSATSTGSFGRLDNISKIVADASDTTGLSIPTGTVSGSAQLATSISGSFNKGFTVGGDISGSATSTGSFSRVNFNKLSATNVSGITGHETGHLTGASGIASQISGAFQHGFEYIGVISASSPSTLKVQNVDLTGNFNFGSFKLTKNWDGTLVRTATFGSVLGSRISGSFNHGFSYQGTIAGSTTSTGSFNKIESQELFVKEMIGERKPISGSMGHDTYISASYKTDSHGKVSIPTFGRGHTVNTQQFSATGSMESQKYRARAGQLFVDNFGRLNMTVQTGSMVAVAGTWTEGPDYPNPARGPGAVGTPYAAMVAGGQNLTSSAQYDGVSWSGTGDTTHKRDAGSNNKSVGTVDAALFIGHTGGAGNFAAPGFSGVPNFNDFFEIWDGVSFSRCGAAAGRITGHSFRYGAGAKGGSSNSHIVFGGDYGSFGYSRTSCWNGVNWSAASYNLNNDRTYGAGFGGPHDAVYAGGASPLNTCNEEWNGSTWATATALPTAQQAGGGIGHTQNAGLVTGGSNTALVQEYNGTTWSEQSALPSGTNEHGTAGSAAGGFVLKGLGGSKGFQQWTGGFITGSAETYNNFSQNPTGRYLLTKKLQANHSPGCAGGGSTSNDEDFGGGY